MKKVQSFLSLLIVLIISFVFLKCGAQPENSRVALWKFDEVKGKLAFDNVSHTWDSIHYIFNSIAPYHDPVRRKGIAGNALVFDGFSNWIERPSANFATPVEAITISAWIAPRAFENGDGGKLSAIVNQQNITDKAGFALGMFKHGRWSFQVGTGSTWIEIWDEGHLLPRRQWSYLAATYESLTGKASLYLNGQLISEKTFFENFPIKPANEPLIIGKHNQAELLDKQSNVKLNMFNGLMDNLKIYNRALTKLEISESYNSDLTFYENKIPRISYEQIKIDRAQFKDDPDRPQYHAIPPGAWMNEPHAPFYYNGKYHLTYQHNPTGPYWHQIHWGHWASNDMVNWYDLPEAIFPENDTIAPDGIWSGSATIDDKGIPVYFYTFGNWSKTHNQGVALAFPHNPKDSNLTVWVKGVKPLITQNDGQGLTGEFRDPFAWKDKENNKWYVLVGSGIKDKGGTAWLYESGDFHEWKLKGPFYQSNYSKYPFLGSIWELPVFLPIGKYKNGETRYIMIVSPKGYNQNVEVYYWLGKFDKIDGRFIPDNEEPQYWDYGVRTFIGPSGMVDPKTGGVLIFAIAAGGHGPGWAAGCASFPTHIFLDKNGNIGAKPVDELKTLRRKELISVFNQSLSQVNQKLKNVNGDMLEIILDLKSKANKYGIKIRKSPDNKEATSLMYDAVNKKLSADLSRSSLKRVNTNDPLSGTDKRTNLIQHFDVEGGSLKLHIFIDKALIQTYANDKKTITTWSYPSLLTSKGLEIYSEDGNAKVKSIQVWEMRSIYY